MWPFVPAFSGLRCMGKDVEIDDVIDNTITLLC